MPAELLPPLLQNLYVSTTPFDADPVLWGYLLLDCAK